MGPRRAMKIDCRSCVMYESEHCSDCLVTALLHPPSAEIEIDDGLDASLGTLGDMGLVPVLKFRPREEVGPPAPTRSEWKNVRNPNVFGHRTDLERGDSTGARA